MHVLQSLEKFDLISSYIQAQNLNGKEEYLHNLNTVSLKCFCEIICINGVNLLDLGFHEIRSGAEDLSNKLSIDKNL